MRDLKESACEAVNGGKISTEWRQVTDSLFLRSPNSAVTRASMWLVALVWLAQNRISRLSNKPVFILTL